MTMDSVQRDVTIMFTDIVGYSAMIGRNESHALKLLDEHNQTIEPTIKSHNGRIIKHIGDAIFAEFDNPTDAVNASIIFQNKFKERNSLSRREDHIQIRVGLHKGEVVVKEDDLFGNAVNIGSRIESIAPLGGIAISNEIHESINIDSYSIRKMGHVKLKNIKSPQQVYKLYLDKNEFEAESENEFHQSHIERGIDIIDPKTYEENEIISIGFLYLKNLGSKEDEYFSYGLQDTLISEMKGIDGISTPSIQEVVKFKENELPVSEIARRLKVNNIIDGSISIHDNDINIDLRLLNIDSGSEVWVKHFDGRKSTTGKLIHNIIYTLLTQFEIEIPERVSRIESNEKTNNPQALEKYMRGFQTMEMAKSQDDLEKAKILFKDAYVLDPYYIDAHAQYAVTCSKLGNFEEAEIILKKSLTIAEKNKDEESLAYVFNLLGFIYNSWNKYDHARNIFFKGLELQVELGSKLQEAKFLNGLSGAYNGIGDSSSAKDYQLRAIRLKEDIGDDQLLATSYASMGSTYSLELDYSKSNEWYLNALGKFSTLKNDYQRMKVLILLTRNYIELGQAIKAKKYINEAHFISRHFDDPLFIGMIYNQMAKIALLEEDLSSSIDAFNEAIDLFQIVDSRLSLLGALFDITIVYIFQSEINKAISQQKKAQRLIKKYDIKKFKVKFGVIELVIRCLKDELNNSDLIDAVTQLKGVNNRNLYLEWWLLARCYYQLEEFNHADECHSIAKKSINEILDGISHDADKKYYKNNNQHYSQIHSPLMGFIKKENLEISFCSQCGQKVEPGFTFCAGCGNKLIA